MGFEIAVDVGGTFTDLVCSDNNREINTFKAPTTPDNVIDGVFNAIKSAATFYRMSVEDFLLRCDKFAYGSTIGTNAIIEERGAKTGQICTKGFRDTLLIREGGKRDTYNLFVDYPSPYIPRYLTLEVTERINSEGGIEIPLDEKEVRKVISVFKKWNVKAIAVSLLWSISNPVHEKRIGQIIVEEYPEVFYSLSHEVNPCVREYRRTSATAIDASLKPIIVKSTAEIEKRLNNSGFKGTLTHVTSSGGQTSSEDIIRKPVFIVFSGPSMGPVAGRTLAAQELDSGNAITVDMGGTSFDVSIITGGEIPMFREGIIGNHMFGVPSVDVKTIGAGGGSIAWIDPGGFIHVGPQSAGAIPGPACYMRGGTEPTVTDANLVRGFLDPDYFVGGAMKLSPKLADEVISEKIAKPLGMALHEAAALICFTCEQSMIAAIEDITVRQGIDPREYVMVAGGAAAGLHAVPIAKELGISKIIIPKAAGVMSAFGILTSDVKFLFALSFFTHSLNFDYTKVNAVAGELEKKAKTYLSKMKISPERRKLHFTVEARYAGQIWQLTLPIQDSRIRIEQELAQVVEDFHNLHEKVYSVKNTEDYIEFIEWDMEAVGKLPEFKLKKHKPGTEDPSAALRQKRNAYFKESERIVETPVYLGDKLASGNEIAGPAIIQEPLTTIVLYPESKTTVSEFGSYIVDLY
jgi:N-methylhydantoinase A